jgi:predicted nucleic acid-binding protein
VSITCDYAIEAEAARLASIYLLRGFDAVHLATANAARKAVPECTLFVCFDQRLSDAAVAEQFRQVTTP